MLFPGYGLRDEHVRHLLWRIRRTRDGRAHRTCAAGHGGDVRARRLESRGMEIIRADAEDLLTELERCAGGG